MSSQLSTYSQSKQPYQHLSETMKDVQLRLVKSKGKATRVSKAAGPLVELRRYKSSVYASNSSPVSEPYVPAPTQEISAVQPEQLSKTERAYHDVVERDGTIQPDHVSRSAIPTEQPLPAKFKAPEEGNRSQPAEDGRFCICERPYLHGELMFKCEGYCSNWYHPKCLGMQDTEIEKHCKKEERWYCTECIQRAYNLLYTCALLKPSTC
jgi:hypothetical protein